MKKKYYSVRTKKRSENLDIPTLKRLFVILFQNFEESGYFQEYFGYWCVDANTPDNWIPGKFGRDIEAKMFSLLLKENLWPIPGKIKNYSEDDLFDVVEFLFDYISKPLEEDGFYHSFSGCGWHYSKFDPKNGQSEFQMKVNEILFDYSTGFQLDSNGQILVVGEKGLEDIFKSEIPSRNKSIEEKVKEAVNRYRGSRSDLEERKIAIRELADVLEYIRPQAKKVLTTKDESDLFNLANNFAIRHYNEEQKTNYNKNIWYSWMFYYYLSTIHALLRILKKVTKK